jgi:hypothetical protein
MHTREVLSQAFPCRISAVEALIEATQPRTRNADRLRQIANELDEVSTFDDRASWGVTYAALAELLRTLSMLVEWRAAIFAAESDSDRFLKSALARHRQWETEYGTSTAAAQLKNAAAEIAHVNDIDHVARVCQVLARTPLPIVFTVDESMRIPGGPKDAQDETVEPPELAVAFLSFLIDQKPAKEIDFLTPGEVHDLELRVRVSRWPEAAKSLELRPVTIERPATYDFPVFEFSRPPGDPPFHLQRNDRCVLKVPQGLTARPFEFKYAPAFKPDHAEQPIAVVGQRTLRIEGIDFKHNPATGFSGVDQKLLQIRDELRTLSPLISASELEDVLMVLVVLSSWAARVLRDGLLRNVTSEPQFQPEARNELRRSPHLAAELEEHPHAAGGITDLSFRGIRIELKFEDDELVTLKTCGRFMGQTATYVIATGKRIGILCVLDNSPKSSYPAPAEERIGILTLPTDEGKLYVIAVIIQGNFPNPSRL